MRLLLRNGAEIDVYTTHLDAGSSRGDRQARRNQLKRIRKKIEKKSRGRAVIFAGDLNIGYDPAPEPGPAPTNLEAFMIASVGGLRVFEYDCNASFTLLGFFISAPHVAKHFAKTYASCIAWLAP